jgi:cell division protein FtsZ
VPAIAVNTDAPHLLRLEVTERILVGQRQFQGRGSGGDRRRVQEGALEAREELLRRLSRYEIVFLLAGLGGGTGSALLPFLASELKDTATLAVPVAFLPFHIELESNPERRANTLEAVDELEEMGGLLLALSNEKLRRFEALPMREVLHVRNAYLHSLVSGLVDMVEHPSQMNVDLASLKYHLKDSGVSTLLLSEEHVSEPERLVHVALNETLLDFELSDAPSALVHVDGGSNLTLRTVDRVWRAMRHRLGEPRRMLVGTRTHPEPREVVRLTAVVGGLRPRSVRDAVTTPVLAR